MGNILYTQSEVGMMSKLGGGTSGYFGNIRHRGSAVKNNGQASGAVHIMQLFETMVDDVSQGSVRRGRFSPYLPVEHSDIEEFLEIGTEGNPIQELTHGVTVTDEWMESMIEGDQEKRAIWAKVIQEEEKLATHIFSSQIKQIMVLLKYLKIKDIKLLLATYVQKSCYLLTQSGHLFVYCHLLIYYTSINGKILMQ